ncbi:uncharacterized protein LOC128892341 [Hylaeus anthracinus]|uniref:uncharacterized protein LOC128892341 n=1 Tax=Hylaeus anthracinus TaxID=313031 RepID=UPI0023B88B5A|nr:uncharacterized protein LOC128892341 [Hylaeus anthracinus]
MRLLYKTALLLLVAGMVYSNTSSKIEPTCDCTYCYNKNENDTEYEDEHITPKLYKEDSDGDGNRTICARDREFNDRTFPSVCHMLCYNRCLILRLSTVKDSKTEINVVIAFRNNYYKLRDGKC